MTEGYTDNYGGLANPYNGGEACKTHGRTFPQDSLLRWLLGVSLIVIVLVITIVVTSLANSLVSIRGDISTIRSGANEFISAARNGEADTLKTSAAKVDKAAKSIQQELDGPIWELTTRIPIIGSDVSNIRMLAAVLNDFSENALSPMAESQNILALGEFFSEDSINASALPTMLKAVDEAMPSLNRASMALSSLPKCNIWPLRTIVDSATETIVASDEFLTRMRPVFPYLPELLGADGKDRNYLILAENTAEIRAMGGYVGYLGVMSANNGDITMGDFKSLGDAISRLEEPAGATPEEINAFGPRAEYYHGDHNVVPDFSRVGQLYFNIWNYYNEDVELSGVFGFDPVFLQYLLAATGPVETSKGITLDSTNAAAILLNQSLFWWEPGECDEFYKEVTDKVLTKLLHDRQGIDVAQLLKAISKAVDDNRCIVWVRDPGAESALKEAGFAGEIKHDPTKPQTGIYISDASTSKMSYYLSCDTTVSEPRLNSDGSKSYDIQVVLKNNFDPGAYKTIPDYIKVQAIGLGKRSDYDLYEEIRLIAPEGGSIQDLNTERLDTRDGEPADIGWSDHKYQGLQVKAATFRINAQESVVLRYTVNVSPEATDALVLRKTPLMPVEYAYWNTNLHPELVK